MLGVWEPRFDSDSRVAFLMDSEHVPLACWLLVKAFVECFFCGFGRLGRPEVAV